ncbi:MAG: ATP-binding protein, partial [Bdellovibrionota bacterium]
NQLLTLVNEILDLSKVESKKMELEQMNFSIVALLKDVVSALAMKAQQKNIQLEIDFKNLKNEYVISDSLRVRQILFNLLGNSLKFTSKGRILVRVTEVPIDINHSEIQFQIEDTGIGMSLAQQEKLFAPFEQGDSSVTRRYGGTGLGLFLSRKLAELLGGELVLVKSAPNEGSTFLFKLKVELSQLLNPLPTEPADPLGELLPAAPINDVLVVDDSVENRILMDAYLNRMQIPHDFAENGRGALEKMFAHKYSVVFMDVQMPEMDGITAIKQARKEGYSGKVVALTAHAMKGDREHCISHGFDDYLCKPLSRKTLEAFLHSKNQPIH